ncbi:MAG: DNA/RNA nuclease SfsA [Proteobacteria bacterium]|nr:DNA/RNA nuclease SfsA [Pseudomonadota bacterium]
MLFDGLVPGTLVRRYKRFFADVRLEDGTIAVAHCTNTGRMTGCSDPGSRVWISRATNPKRKLKWTWELAEVAPGVLLGVNTFLANRIAQEAVEAGLVPGLNDVSTIEREVKLDETTRSDLRVDGRVWIEVKNVTLADGRRGRFPDAPTSRGQKHLAALARAVGRGDRGMLLHLVLRPDIDVVEPADDVDPDWGRAIREAAAAGVEVVAIGAEVSPEGIVPVRALPVRL